MAAMAENEEPRSACARRAFVKRDVMRPIRLVRRCTGEI
jgi:hypothetical protein